MNPSSVGTQSGSASDSPWRRLELLRPLLPIERTPMQGPGGEILPELHIKELMSTTSIKEANDLIASAEWVVLHVTGGLHSPVEYVLGKVKEAG